MTELMQEETDETERPSKSQRKRDMLALQKLGEGLLALSPEQVQRMALPEDLAEALRFYHTIKDKEARRRQQQYIGAVMRRIDPEPVHQALAAMDQMRQQQTSVFHHIESCRDALVAGDEGQLLEVVGRFGLDIRQIRRLARLAAEEKATGRPPKQGRELFRLLRQAFETEGRTGQVEAEAEETIQSSVRP